MNIYVLLEYWWEDTEIIGCYIDKEQCVKEGKRRSATPNKWKSLGYTVEEYKEGDNESMSKIVWDSEEE